MRAFQSKQEILSKNHFENFVRGIREIHEVDQRDKEREYHSLERMRSEFQESETNLHKFNMKLQAVNNRLQENFKKRIESLNTDNTRTNDIKIRMNRLEEENKEIRYVIAHSFFVSDSSHFTTNKLNI